MAATLKALPPSGKKSSIKKTLVDSTAVVKSVYQQYKESNGELNHDFDVYIVELKAQIESVLDHPQDTIRFIQNQYRRFALDAIAAASKSVAEYKKEPPHVKFHLEVTLKGLQELEKQHLNALEEAVAAGL